MTMDRKQENEEVRSKVLIIADYLKEEFPSCVVAPPKSPEINYVFDLHAKGNRVYSLTVWRTLLEDDRHSPDGFRARLQQEHVAEELRQNKEWHWR